MKFLNKSNAFRWHHEIEVRVIVSMSPSRHLNNSPIVVEFDETAWCQETLEDSVAEDPTGKCESRFKPFDNCKKKSASLVALDRNLLRGCSYDLKNLWTKFKRTRVRHVIRRTC